MFSTPHGEFPSRRRYNDRGPQAFSPRGPRSMYHLPTILTTAAILASAATARVKADLVVDSWSIGAGISDLAGQEGVHFSTVVNPFQNSHSVSYRNSNISASYDIGWLLDEAHFDITTTHHLAQLDGQTSTSGRIYLTPSVDSVITMSGNLQYSWPSAAVGTALIGMDILDVTDPDNQILVAGDAVVDGNFPIGQPFGSFNIGDSGIIESGRQYLLSYVAQVRHFDPTPPGTFGEASGDFHFTITPIPEPAAALLLALPFLAIRSRR